MAISEERRGSAVILHLEGDFGEPEPAFDDVLQRAIKDDSADVIVDLLPAASFRAVRTLSRAEKLRRDLGGRRRFAVVADTDSDTGIMLALAGFSKIAPVFASVEDAMQSWETDGMPI